MVKKIVLLARENVWKQRWHAISYILTFSRLKIKRVPFVAVGSQQINICVRCADFGIFDEGKHILQINMKKMKNKNLPKHHKLVS